jgi:hypothetical protein
VACGLAGCRQRIGQPDARTRRRRRTRPRQGQIESVEQVKPPVVDRITSPHANQNPLRSPRGSRCLGQQDRVDGCVQVDDEEGNDQLSIAVKQRHSGCAFGQLPQRDPPKFVRMRRCRVRGHSLA